jgi:hypothetical protein
LASLCSRPRALLRPSLASRTWLGLRCRIQVSQVNRQLRQGPWGAALDVAGVLPGIRAVAKGVKAIGATTRATRTAGLADDVVRAGATKAGGYDPHSVKASYLQGVSNQSATDAHRLERQVRRLNQLGIGMGGVSAARTYLPKIGIEHPPLTAAAGLLMRPPVSLAPAR